MLKFFYEREPYSRHFCSFWVIFLWKRTRTLVWHLHHRLMRLLIIPKSLWKLRTYGMYLSIDTSHQTCIIYVKRLNFASTSNYKSKMFFCSWWALIWTSLHLLVSFVLVRLRVLVQNILFSLHDLTILDLMLPRQQ